MKTRILKFTAILLIIAGGFSACEKPQKPEELNCIIEEGTVLFRYLQGERLYFNISSCEIVIIVGENATESDVKSFFQKNYYLEVFDMRPIVNGEFKLVRFRNSNRDIILQMMNHLKPNDTVLFVGYVSINAEGRRGSALTNIISVRLKDYDDFPVLLEAISSYDIINIREPDSLSTSRTYHLTVNYFSEKTSLQIANELFETGLFEWASPDLILFLGFSTNDTHFNQQWGLQNAVQFGGTNIDIRAQHAWTITRGSPNIRIAILDSGVDLQHPDLTANLLPGFNAATNTAGGGAMPAHYENRSHGTSVAGIVAAQANNNRGIAGVAHNSRILPVSVELEANAERVTRGLHWARQNGARVINMSFYVVGDITDDLISALNAATAANIVLVAASGNNGSSTVDFPASRPDVIAVGAINRNGHRWTGSNYGAGLNVVAPGAGIFTTGMTNDPRIGQSHIVNDGVNNGIYFRDINGTSLAAPHVAGVAALILSVRPDLTAQQVRNVIEQTANRSLPGWTTTQTLPNGSWNNHFGHGLVDAYAALRAVAPSISGPDFICGSNSVTFSLSNLPSNVSVVWTASPGLLVSGNNNSATVSNNTQYSVVGGWVRATVFWNNSIFTTLQKPVFAWRSGVQCTHVSAALIGSVHNLENSAFLHHPAGIGQAEQFFMPGSNFYWSSSNWNIFFMMQGRHWTQYMFWGPTWGSFDITVNFTDVCGGHSIMSIHRYADSGYPFQFIAYPNPARDILTVRLNDEQMEMQASGRAAALGNIELKLYNHEGQLLRRQTMGVMVRQATIDTSGLSTGNYVLHIVVDGEVVERQTIMIEN